MCNMHPGCGCLGFRNVLMRSAPEHSTLTGGLRLRLGRRLRHSIGDLLISLAHVFRFTLSEIMLSRAEAV